jgi:hypothetical protein
LHPSTGCIDGILYTKYKNNAVDQKYANDKSNNLVIDIEHTLLQILDRDHLPPVWRGKFQHYEFNNKVYVMRPYAKEFLETAFKYFRVGFWSVMEETQMSFVLQKIILPLVGKKMKDIAFAFSIKEYMDCHSKTGKHKDLEYVNHRYPIFRLYRTFIIDDFIEVKKTNEHWCLDVTEFRPVTVDKQNNTLYIDDQFTNETELQDLASWLISFREYVVKGG